ncbi:hypothetical protein BGZ95_007713 [Linnemannia exigua]|uniref:Uncharacterized protein n=1 Tax=Linnemannia exigua TaxID=604196 RepID=A0AAD4DFD4_9FUNG|nr:hypothetical protein BGZ95_007713 [Linnemannia exigua]
MNQGSLMNRAINQFETIVGLEAKENQIRALLNTPSPYLSGEFLFDGGEGFQSERSQIYALRQQIYSCSLALKGFLDDIEQLQQQQGQNDFATRVRAMRLRMQHTMAIRRDQLMFEVCVYLARDCPINDDHIHLNRSLSSYILKNFKNSDV